MGELFFWLLLLAGLGRREGDSSRPSQGKPDTGKPTPAQLPVPNVPRPAGNPFGRDCQAGVFNQDMFSTRQSILTAFAALGYEVPTDRDTMNELGADESVGGGDDLPNPEVQLFQTHYNVASQKGYLGGDAGGLAMDGFVGPCTLNGLEKVLTVFSGADQWRNVLGIA